jgi:hypothetical protein
MANLNFNANEVEPAAPITALPPGRYPVAISKTEMKATKAGTGEYLQIELTVTSGTATNRKLWARLNLVNQNQQAVDIARRELSAICHAVGVLQVNDSDELLGREMMVDVAIEKNGQTGEDTNKVKGYSALSAAPARPGLGQSLPASKPAAAKAAPWQKAAA